MPNQMMNNGTSAIFGIGNNAETTAIPGERAADHSPDRQADRNSADGYSIVQPIASRANEADRCRQ